MAEWKVTNELIGLAMVGLIAALGFTWWKLALLLQRIERDSGQALGLLQEQTLEPSAECKFPDVGNLAETMQAENKRRDEQMARLLSEMSATQSTLRAVSSQLLPIANDFTNINSILTYLRSEMGKVASNASNTNYLAQRTLKLAEDAYRKPGPGEVDPIATLTEKVIAIGALEADTANRLLRIEDALAKHAPAKATHKIQRRLTADQQREIQLRFRKGERGRRGTGNSAALAAEYGVSQKTIRDIGAKAATEM